MRQPAFRYIYILLLLVAFMADSLYAQPANDNWANASEIIIGNDGFDRGVFQSDTVNMTGATNQFGEYLDNPTYPKTVWYKFTIPTHRVVRIKVLQPTEALESNAAGFVVYEETSSVPSASDLAIFTPFYSFASYSENVCLEAGTYYIQAVAKNSANSNIFVEIDIVHTYGVSHSEATDRINLKYNFGVVPTTATRSINWSCTSIDSDAERAHISGSDSLDYNKSIWAKFTTDSHIDLFHFRLSNWPAGETGYIQIWEGDIDSADVGVQTPIYQKALTQLHYDHYLPCILDSNTTYTIQVVARETVTNTQTFRIGHIGEGETTGAYPQEADFHPNNQLGMISPVPDPGVAVSSHDFFSCASNLQNDSIVCGTANPADTAYIGGSNFQLTTWFTFSTDAESNTVIKTTLQRPGTSFGANHNMGYRIYNQIADNDCDNYSYPADIYAEGIFPASGLMQLKCLPPGDYAIQLLGKTTPIVDGTNINFNHTHLGARINITLTSHGVPVLTFGLDGPGEVDFINAGNPLAQSVEYAADSAYFSCTKTVLPDTAICESGIDRAIYRQIVIGDADGDAVPDSGMLVITGLAAFNAPLNQASNSPFYKGDANALAIAQSSFSWPGTIDGLDPYDGCNMYNAKYNYWVSPIYFLADYDMKKYCVTPGTYTLASVGDHTENGLLVRPKFRFEKTTSLFSNPAAPEDMGDIIAQGLSVISQDDYFSCLDNPDTIAGYVPCGGFTKQLYREFYVSQACRLSVNSLSSNYPWSQMRLFSGRVSDVGIAGLTLAPFHSSGCYSGHSSGDYSVPACASVPAGWYTVVSYGFGPNYDNNHEFHETHLYSNYGGGANALYSIDEYDRIAVSVDTSITPGPFYNRPHKACAHPDTIKYVNTATEDFPSIGTTYTFCQEYFSSQTDTPMVNMPIDPCMNAVRLAYYVFTTDKEYYATIGGISSYYSELYELDAREDSMLFPSTEPLISCESYPNNMTVCRLQPGTYTLVVYATASQQCVHIQPNIRVAPVDVSRFDWAGAAYDFDLIPPDNTAYGGAVGDTHPTNTNYLPSNDFIYCTTGASTTDPSVSCGFPYYPEIYPDTINDVYFDGPGTYNENIRRNLWYTFVLQGTGNAKVQVRNLTNGWTPGFTIFKSDVDATLPYSSIVGTAEQDSTSAQGLTFIANNLTSTYYCFQNKSEVVNFQYFNDPCIVDSTYRRYYVLVEMKEGTPLPMQVDVQITWNPIVTNPQDPLYDYFYQANVLGAGEIAPPYSNTPLEIDSLYTGGWGNLSCATTDTTDTSLQNCATLKTLWYKVIIDQPGFLYIGTETDALNPTFNLLEHINAPDSIVSANGINGLYNRGTGSYANMNSIYSNATWRYFCLEPGTYYANLRTCNALDTSKVRIHAYFREITGNNCANAPFVEAPALGVYNLSDPVECHRIGDDFGEDGSDMGCLLGPEGYSSSWFKFSYTGTDLVDILFQLNLGSLYNYGGPDQIRYRLFYGNDCATMIQGAECSVNAFINNSVACVSAAEGDFYVQVTYKNTATGTLGFRFTVSENTNPDCNPFMPSLLTSDYVYQMNCAGDSLYFTNYSTSGSNLTYYWDFGDGMNTSTETNPNFAYANPGAYNVSLSVINPANQDTVTSSQLINFEIGVSPLDLGTNKTMCLGETATIGQFISQATYLWSTGEITPEIDTQNAGDYFVDIILNGCMYSDTISVEVIDLNIDLGPDIEMCLGDTIELAYTGTDNPDYTWSTGSADSSLTITQAGTYWLKINEGSCVKSDTVDVVVHDLSFDLGNDTTICAGTSYYLNPNLPPGLSYNWNTGAAIDSILIASANTYSLEVGFAGCSATSEMVVSVLDLQVELGSDTTICIGESLILTPETNAVVNYLWNNGSTNPTLSVNNPGWYKVNVEALSCQNTDSILVSVLDLSFDLPPDTTICLGANILIDPELSAGLNYTWNTGSSATTILTDTAGVYQLSVDSIGCYAQSEMEVSILDLTFSLGPDSTICDGDNITLSPDISIGEVYLWSDNSTGTNLTVDTAGVYELEISKDGCSANDQVDISIFYVGALFPESLTACLHDTTLLAVTDADSLIWTSGQSNITVIDELNFDFHPGNTATYNWTAYQNGCQKTGDFDFEVIQPYIPNPTYDDIYCRNEAEIILPTIDLTTGTYSLDGSPVTAINIANHGTGDFEVLYTYTDTNTCAYHITLAYSIVDTTTISFDPGVTCADGDPINLVPFLSHGPGQTSTKYDLANWTDGLVFYTDSIQQTITSPLSVPIRYTFVNDQNCQSVVRENILVHPLPVVAFSANPVCAGDTAVFTNTSFVTGSSIENQEWTFESNGVFSGSATNNLVYHTGGFYDITLQVTSDIGCSRSLTKSLEVWGLPVLTADTFGPFCINAGDVLTPNVSPQGGNFSIDDIVILTFDTYQMGSGMHNYKYSYTDGNGCYNELSRQVLINDTTTISYNSPFEPICIDSEEFNLKPYLSHPSGQTFVKYDLLNWTADSIFNAENVAQNIVNPRTVPVLFSYTNDDGCESVLPNEVTVHPLPVINVNVPDICANEMLVVTNNSYVNGSAIQSTSWNIQDQGEFDTFQLEPMSFTGPDTLVYTINMISEIGCYNADTAYFIVFPVPDIDFDWAGSCVNEIVEFASNHTISNGSITGFNWIINGNQNPGSSPLFTYLFPNYGMHEVGLTATSDKGCTETIYRNVHVSAAPVGGMILEDHCLDTKTKIIPNATIAEGEIVEINWLSPGEFDTSSIGGLTHTFNDHGLKTIHQEVISAGGCVSVFSAEVRVYPLPQLSFTSSIDSICAGNNITLKNTSAIAAPSSIISMEWTINKNLTFTDKTISFTGSKPGFTHVEMTGISDFGCVSHLIDDTRIKVLPNPKASFAFDKNPLEISDPTVRITDLSTKDVVVWTYDTGDGKTYNYANPDHTYKEIGEYKVEQFVINKHGCSDAAYSLIGVEGFIVYVPNAFTPDADGLNDIFKPVVYGEDIHEYKFQIWNRNGELIFETRDVNEGWNGSSPEKHYFSENTVFQYYVLVQGKTNRLPFETRGMVVLVR